MPKAVTRKLPLTAKAGTSPATDSTSLLRALAILELISHKPGGLTNAEISRRLHIATSSTSYILSRLERALYIKRTAERGRYELSLKVIGLAHGALREMGLRRAAEPVLHRLAAQSGCSGLIGVLDRGLVMIVDKVEQPSLVPFDMDLGVRYPAHSTALGRVLLAHLPAATVTELFKVPAAKTSRSPNGGFERLRKDLEGIRRQGYAVSDGELFMGVWAVAAPIFDASGCVLAAVSAAGTPRPRNEDLVIEQIKRTAKEISARVIESDSRKLQ